MSDAQTRELQRRAAQGDVDAQAKLLLGRTRRGELTDERLRLAAYLGHAGAIRAVAEQVADLPGQLEYGVEALGTWGRCLHAFGTAAPVRAAIAAARSVCTSLPPGMRRDLATGLIRSAEDWVVNHSSTTHAAARQAVHDSADLVDLTSPDEHAINSAWAAAKAAAASALPEGSPDAPRRARAAAKYTETALVSAYGSLDPQAVAEAIQAELLPWALGEGDSLRDRVAARKT